MALAIVLLVAVAAVATGPHHWVGELWCEVQGGEWTNRFRSRQEEIVTGGRTCVK